MDDELWRSIKPQTLKQIRRMLILKHGSLTQAALELPAHYQILGDTLNGRRYTSGTIAAIQSDLELSDEDVLRLWPLLKRWPKRAA